MPNPPLKRVSRPDLPERFARMWERSMAMRGDATFFEVMAANPELLDWLTKGFVGHGYDMKWLHRQIVSSHAYQRGWKPNDTNRDDRDRPARVEAAPPCDDQSQPTSAALRRSTSFASPERPRRRYDTNRAGRVVQDKQ